MNWRFLISVCLALVYLAWLWRDRKAYDRAGLVLGLVGSIGIAVHLTCSYISTLPSHAPLRTVIGLATNKSSFFLNRRKSDFLLIEAGTGHRILLSTLIEGPWADQPVRATYVDDGRYIASVVRIEILSESQFPWWHVQKGHAGWVGTTEAKRRAPLIMSFAGFLLILAGAFAPTRSGRYRLATE